MTLSFRISSQPAHLDIGDYAHCSCFRLHGALPDRSNGPGWLAKKCLVRVQWRCLLTGTDD